MRLVAALLGMLALPVQADPGLARWKLTLPIDADGNGRADEIADPAATELPPWFRKTPEGLLFVAPAGGARTSDNTAYARSELREMEAPGKAAAWDCLKASRSMKLSQRLLSSPLAKPEVAIGQIHDARNDNLILRYVGPAVADGRRDTGRIELLWNNASRRELLDAAYTLGQPMDITITIRQGRLEVAYRNAASGVVKQVDAALDAGLVSGACFFKAGLYIQACSRTDLAGLPNAACRKKGWAAARYDAPETSASLLIEALELDPPGF